MAGFDLISLWKHADFLSRFSYLFFTSVTFRSLWNLAVFANSRRSDKGRATPEDIREIRIRLRAIPNCIKLSILLCAFASAWEVLLWQTSNSYRIPNGDYAGGPAEILVLPLMAFGCCTVMYAGYCLAIWAEYRRTFAR